jgi:hypothetical protein
MYCPSYACVTALAVSLASLRLPCAPLRLIRADGRGNVGHEIERSDIDGGGGSR